MNDRQSTEKLHSGSNDNVQNPQESTRSMNNKRSFEDVVLSTTSAASQSNKRHKQSNFHSPSQEIARSRLDLNEKPIESNEGSEGRADITKQCATSSISQNTHAINNTCNALDMNLKITKALPVDVNKGLVNIGLSCAKSASFGHMICQHDSVTQNEPTSTSVVPRITNLDESTTATKDRDVFVHHTEERFEGFINSQEQRVGRDEGYSNINPALKIPSIACIAQQYADSGSLNGSTKERTVDFEELSKKYHFLEDGFPSFRWKLVNVVV